MIYPTALLLMSGASASSGAWKMLNHGAGSPVRCGAEGILQCASDDGTSCKWGTYGSHADYAEVPSVTASNPLEINCPGWVPYDGKDACAELGCYAPGNCPSCEIENGDPKLSFHCDNEAATYVCEETGTSCSCDCDGHYGNTCKSIRVGGQHITLGGSCNDDTQSPTNQPTTSPTNNPTTSPTSSPTKASWVYQSGNNYYINLPSTDNWSQYYPLLTTWTKLRLASAPTKGQTEVTVDMTDRTFASSNGHTSNAHSLTSMEWGIGADCRTGGHQSSYKINLVGTPFKLESNQPVSKPGGWRPHGSASCSNNQQTCSGSCGGRCGYCGFGHAGSVKSVTLKVNDQSLFNNAL